jgi:hypothetical protein
MAAHGLTCNAMVSQEPIQMLLGRPLIQPARLVHLEIIVFLDHLPKPYVQLAFSVTALLAEFHVRVERTAHKVLCNRVLVQQAVCVSFHPQCEFALLVHIVHRTAQLNCCVGLEVTAHWVLFNQVLVQLAVCVSPRQPYGSVLLVRIVHRAAQWS